MGRAGKRVSELAGERKVSAWTHTRQAVSGLERNVESARVGGVKMPDAR